MSGELCSTHLLFFNYVYYSDILKLYLFVISLIRIFDPLHQLCIDNYCQLDNYFKTIK